MNKLLSATALACVLVLPALTVEAGEARTERPSDADIRAFEECQRGKATEPCIFPERRPTTVKDELVGQAGDALADAPFYQAPASELTRGSGNRSVRDHIRRAYAYRTYQWGPLRTQDGPAEPFGSYSRRDGQAGDTASTSNSSNSTGNTASASSNSTPASAPASASSGRPSRGENCRGGRGGRGRGSRR